MSHVSLVVTSGDPNSLVGFKKEEMLSPKFTFQAEIGRLGDLVVWEVRLACMDILLLLQIPIFPAPRVQPAVKYHHSTGNEGLAPDPRYKSQGQKEGRNAVSALQFYCRQLCNSPPLRGNLLPQVVSVPGE